MDDRAELIELLRRIEANQLAALEAQRQQVALVREQIERSEKRVAESVALQKLAVSRQATLVKFVAPLIVALLALLGYLLVRWRVF